MTLAACGHNRLEKGHCGKTSWVGQHSGLKVVMPEPGTGGKKETAEMGTVTQDYNPAGWGRKKTDTSSLRLAWAIQQVTKAIQGYTATLCLQKPRKKQQLRTAQELKWPKVIQRFGPQLVSWWTMTVIKSRSPRREGKIWARERTADCLPLVSELGYLPAESGVRTGNILTFLFHQSEVPKFLNEPTSVSASFSQQPSSFYHGLALSKVTENAWRSFVLKEL